MSRLEWTRAARKRIIGQKPTTITIHRSDLLEDGTHRREVKNTVGPLVVRLFSSNQGAASEQDSDAGNVQIDSSWGLIADYQADLRAGEWVTDRFEVVGVGSFRIAAVRPQLVDGGIAGYAASLEKVN